MRDDTDRLRDILASAEAAVAYASPRTRLHAGDDLVLAAVTHQLVVIGEAANAVSEETRLAYPSLPWHLMIGVRNRIVHAYWSVDAERVWATVDADLGPLVSLLHAIVDVDEAS
ncbi:MAG: HepT-like ribonuclease domain-containing protein [Candidatus Limnocylindria bacterium]